MPPFYKGLIIGAVTCGALGSAVLYALSHPVHGPMPDAATSVRLIEECEDRYEVTCYVVVSPSGEVLAVPDHYEMLTDE